MYMLCVDIFFSKDSSSDLHHVYHPVRDKEKGYIILSDEDTERRYLKVKRLARSTVQFTAYRNKQRIDGCTSNDDQRLFGTDQREILSSHVTAHVTWTRERHYRHMSHWPKRATIVTAHVTSIKPRVRNLPMGEVIFLVHQLTVSAHSGTLEITPSKRQSPITVNTLS